jgi:hypothetical protein
MELGISAFSAILVIVRILVEKERNSHRLLALGVTDLDLISPDNH